MVKREGREIEKILRRSKPPSALELIIEDNLRRREREKKRKSIFEEILMRPSSDEGRKEE